MLLIISTNVDFYFKRYSVNLIYYFVFIMTFFYVLKHVMNVRNVHLSVFSLCLSTPVINEIPENNSILL
jgi:hypothetical protein